MTHIGAEMTKPAGLGLDPAAGSDATRAVGAQARLSELRTAASHSSGDAHAQGALAPPLPPPAAPRTPLDERTLQAMDAFQAEIGGLGAAWGRALAAQDAANEVALHQSRAAVSASFDPTINLIRDGGMHYFMRLRMQEGHSGAAELQRLAQGSVRAQEMHLEQQREHAKTAATLARKMGPWLARAHLVSKGLHGLALAAGCVAGAVAAVTVTPVASGASMVAGLGLAAVMAGCAIGRSGAVDLRHAIMALDVAALAGVLLLTATQANPWLTPMIVGSQVLDAGARAVQQCLQSGYDADMRETDALGHMSRVMGTMHERGYGASMDALQRITQSHKHTMSAINAMLRSSQQVNNLQIRNLRK